MNPLIICGFPGVGKSTLTNLRKDVEDMESSAYSHIFNPLAGADEMFDRNPAFPGNYADAIEAARKTSQRVMYGPINYLLISSHESVRSELKSRGIPYIIVAPRPELRQEYLRRYVARCSPIELIETINDNWSKFLSSIEQDGAPVIWLNKGEVLADVIPRLM